MSAELLGWIAACLAGLPFALALINWALIRTPMIGAVRSGDFLSILIPARNEAVNIAAAIASARSVEAVDVEILVMDDGSTDDTAAIVAHIAARDRRVRLLSAPALPPGWSGKAHGCQRLAEAARGSHLLFMDADVRVCPDGPARLLSHARSTGCAFVSAVPRQIIGGVGEGLLVPTVNMLIHGYFPALFMRLFRARMFAIGCGQLMLVERSAYLSAGGHGSIKGTRHDGLALASRMRAMGFRTDLVAGAELATCRMYGGLGEAWAGFGRNATEGMARPLGLPIWTALLGGAHGLPFLLVPLAPSLPVIVAAGLSLAVRSLITWRVREPWWTVPLHPFTIVATLMLQWVAFVRARRGRTVAWKGRTYGAMAPIPGKEPRTVMASEARRARAEQQG